ncbi:hypothetical protein GQX74_004210 [Glossina fuscipes]|nr:hypothetical protein GQX74_004210 [Glossina fuscipes]
MIGNCNEKARISLRVLKCILDQTNSPNALHWWYSTSFGYGRINSTFDIETMAQLHSQPKIVIKLDRRSIVRTCLSAVIAYEIVFAKIIFKNCANAYIDLAVSSKLIMKYSAATETTEQKKTQRTTTNSDELICSQEYYHHRHHHHHHHLNYHHHHNQYYRHQHCLYYHCHRRCSYCSMKRDSTYGSSTPQYGRKPNTVYQITESM